MKTTIKIALLLFHRLSRFKAVNNDDIQPPGISHSKFFFGWNQYYLWQGDVNLAIDLTKLH
jgi:hypothetical protein